ncbi:unnamed protein product [Lampetra fluviatilis]
MGNVYRGDRTIEIGSRTGAKSDVSESPAEGTAELLDDLKTLEVRDNSSSSDEDEFYDADSYAESVSVKALQRFSNCSAESSDSARMSDPGAQDNGEESHANGIKKRRTTLPAPMFSRSNFSIWSFLRRCIGMELSKITMPVIFNEPLSFLQRLCEYMEHTYLIHKANTSSSSIERMQCVAAFAVSAVASNWERTGKPFNPLLGETYEMVREDLGFRLVSEQVSHHPPISAFFAEGLNKDFVFHGSVYPKLKFWGKSVEAEPRGIITLELPRYGEAYTWTNPSCCVHNVIVGKLWIEQYGTVEITNHKTGDKCMLTFKPCGLFGKELHKVEGYILDKNKKKVSVIYGKWTEVLWSVDPGIYEVGKKNDKKSTEKLAKLQAEADEADDIPTPEVPETVTVLPGSKLLWRVHPRPSNSIQMYNFTSFALTLNEMEKEMEGLLAPTDCRLRPDMKAMEQGDIDLAGEEKNRLEEKQRAARKQRAKTEEEWHTRWFRQDLNPHTSTADWIYEGNYFDRRYENCPNIF